MSEDETKGPVLVYVAGPIHGSGTVEKNVHAAVVAGEALRSFGLLTFVPHLNVMWGLIHQHEAAWWLENDLEILKRCDMLLRLPGKSPGSDMEVEFAEKHGIPVVHNVSEAYNLSRGTNLKPVS